MPCVNHYNQARSEAEGTGARVPPFTQKGGAHYLVQTRRKGKNKKKKTEREKKEIREKIFFFVQQYVLCYFSSNLKHCLQ